jgi:hypothetical protein
MRRSVATVGPFACLVATLAIVLLSQQPVVQTPERTVGAVLGGALEVVTVASLASDDAREAIKERAEHGRTARHGPSVVLALAALGIAMCGPRAGGRVTSWACASEPTGRRARTRGRAPPVTTTV